MQECVSYLFARVCRALRGRRTARLSALGLHCGQDLVLQELHEREGLRLADLAERLDVEPPTVTKMIQRMEAAGTVQREPDPSDGRASCVYLTPRGRDLSEELEACWTDIEAQVVAGLTMEERVLLRRLLLQVLSNMEQPNGA